jgi:hypothetical protein
LEKQHFLFLEVEMSFIADRFIAKEIDEALFRHGLTSDSPVRGQLQCNAEITGGRQVSVSVRLDGSRSISLDARIEDLRRDPEFRACFPPEPPRISRHDEQKIRSNFARILSGEAIVE